MKAKIWSLIIALLIITQIGLVLAEHEHLCEHFPTGALFGRHVSMHAQEQHFNGNMNPGMHQGYSICVPK